MFFDQCPIMIKTIDIFQKKCLSKNLFWTNRMQFWQPGWKKFHNRPKTFRSMSGKEFKNFKRSISAEKCPCGHVECSFDNTQRIFRPEAEKFLLTVRKWWKNRLFSEELYFSKTFFGAVKFIFDTRAEKFLTRSWVFFAQDAKISKNLDFFQKNHLSLHCSFGYVECSFDDPVEHFFTKGRNLFAQGPEKFLYFFKRTISLKNVLVGT